MKKSYLCAQMRTIAVILAGGTGQRVGGEKPKQLCRLSDGRTVLETCIDAFRRSPHVDEVMVVMHADWLTEVPSGVRAIAGGKERWESSWKAIEALSQEGEEMNVLLHDCARPFVSERIIADVCEALKEHQAVTVAVPMTETIYRVESRKTKDRCAQRQDGMVRSIPSRREYMRAQTPQAFRLSLIKKAYELALADEAGIQATDDCGIVNKYLPNEAIMVVEGEETNRKITFKEDLR